MAGKVVVVATDHGYRQMETGYQAGRLRHNGRQARYIGRHETGSWSRWRWKIVMDPDCDAP